MEHSTIPELDISGLRRFGLTTGGIFGAIFGLILPWMFEHEFPLWPWILFGVMVFWSLAAPATLGLVYQSWMRLGLLISKVTTPLILGIVFFLIVTPFGLVRSLFAKDPMARELNGNSDSYRVPSEQTTRANLENPY